MKQICSLNNFEHITINGKLLKAPACTPEEASSSQLVQSLVQFLRGFFRRTSELFQPDNFFDKNEKQGLLRSPLLVYIVEPRSGSGLLVHNSPHRFPRNCMLLRHNESLPCLARIHSLRSSNSKNKTWASFKHRVIYVEAVTLTILQLVTV